MRFAIVSVMVGIALGASAMLTMRARGYGALSAAGLALGGAVGAWLNLVLLWSALQRQVGVLFDREAVVPLLRVGLGAVAAGVVGYGTRVLLAGRFPEETTLGAAAVLAGALAAAGGVYLVIVRRPPRPVAHD